MTRFSTSSEDDQTISFGYNASLIHNPLTGEIFIDEPGRSSQGGVVSQSYLDSDYDGSFSEKEAFLKGTLFDINGAKKPYMDADETSEFVMGISPYTLTNIKLNEQTLPEISFYSKEEYITVMVRPGVATEIKFPVIHLGSVEGEIFSREKGKALKGLRIFIKNEEETVSEALSDSDGYYFFEKLKPGKYTLEFDVDQLSVLGYKIPSLFLFKVEKESVFQKLPPIAIEKQK